MRHTTVSRIRPPVLLLGVLLMTAMLPAQPPAEPQKVNVHDPSTLIRCGDEYWFFGTGNGIGSFHSKDLKTWEKGPPVFATPPAWTRQVNEKFKAHFWAPDIIRVGERYLLYYSVSSFGSRNSAIGLATTPTLDPADPRFGWTDHGIVVQTTEQSDHNAIDPALMLDHDGRLWMAYGSFWSGIKVIELDPATGLRKPGATAKPVAHHESIEAAALFEHDGWYYLVVNWGFCCRGVQSTYEMRIGRSRNPQGPFRDRAGRDLAKGGGDLLLGSEGDYIGPGHAGLLRTDPPLLSLHYYDATRHGQPTLALRALKFENGWPVVGPVVFPSPPTTPPATEANAPQRGE